MGRRGGKRKGEREKGREGEGEREREREVWGGRGGGGFGRTCKAGGVSWPGRGEDEGVLEGGGGRGV